MRISLVITTLLLSTLLPPGASASPAPTRFVLLDDGSIVVPVTIGGTGPYRFVVDTGSSRTVISTRLWRALRLPVVAKTQMVTPAGRDEAYVVRLAGLAICCQSEVTVDAAVMAADSICGRPTSRWIDRAGRVVDRHLHDRLRASRHHLALGRMICWEGSACLWTSETSDCS